MFSGVREILSRMPLGYQAVAYNDQLIAAKAELAAKFISRETGEDRDELSRRLCSLAGVEPIKMDPERVLGLRSGVTEDYNFCQYMLEKFPDRFEAVKELVS